MKQYRKSRIQSLIRGLEILKCFTPNKPVLRLVDLSNKLNISKSTLFRYVSTLENLGYLTKDENTKCYKLTIKVLDLGFAALKGLGFSDIATPYLEELAHQCQESASMAILDGFYVVYVARSATKRWMSTNLQIGAKLPAYCTSLGKVVLACRPFSEVRKILEERELKSYTPYTITDLDILQKELIKVRENGYAINNQELEVGLLSSAAPIFGPKGEIIAAINISMSSARISLDELRQKYIPKLIQTATQISNALEYH